MAICYECHKSGSDLPKRDRIANKVTLPALIKRKTRLVCNSCTRTRRRQQKGGREMPKVKRER